MVPDRIQRRANAWFALTIVLTLVVVTAHLSKMAHHLQFLPYAVRQVVFPSLLVPCTAVLLLMAIRQLLLRMERRRKLPALLKTFAMRGIVGTIVDITRIPAVRFLIWGSLIAIIALVPASRKSFFVENARLVMLGSAQGDPATQGDVPVRVLWMSTHGQGLQGRLERLTKVCRDLEAAGAAAVLVESPTAGWAPDDEREFMRAIRQTGIAVVGVRSDDYPPGDPWYRSALIALTPEHQDSLLPARAVLSLRAFPDGIRGRTLSLLTPYRYVSGFGSHDTIPDVVLELLRTFRRYPQTLKPTVTPTSVEFGEYSIPTTSEGAAVFATTWGRGMLTFGALDHWQTGRFGYQSYRGGDTATYEDLDRFASEVRGMIVLVSSYDVLDTRFPALGGIPSYRSILGQVLQRTVPRFEDRFALPATILVIVLSAVAVFFTRLRIAVPAMLALLLISVGLGMAWFRAYNVILDVISPLLAIAMCIALLPLVKISTQAAGTSRVKEDGVLAR